MNWLTSFFFHVPLLLLAIYIWSCILHSSSHLILQFWRNMYLSLHDMSWIALLWMKVFSALFFFLFCKCLLLIYQNYYLYWFLCSASLLLYFIPAGCFLWCCINIPYCFSFFNCLCFCFLCLIFVADWLILKCNLINLTCCSIGY